MRRDISRRQFIATGTAAATAAVSGFPFIRTARASEVPIRVGVVGTGGRGTGACGNAMTADSAVEIVGMAEIARDRVDQSLENLRQATDQDGKPFADRVKVTEDTIFIGPDAFKDLMALDLDYVILATPPGFRPLHVAEALRRGLHVFAEKPVATDPVGCRAMRASALEAKEKGLTVVVGLNNRHDIAVNETINRIHDGAIGEIVGGTIHRLGGWLWHRGNDPSWSPMEYQMRNWIYHIWLSGDQIVEMVIHQIDMMNWALGSTPLQALGHGGRQQRTDPKFGNVWDNMGVEYEYPGGVRVNLMCRHWDGAERSSENRLVGKLGESNESSEILGSNPWKHPRGKGPTYNAYVNEHINLIKSIRSGEARNDLLDYAVDSTLTGIMGREAAYSGKLITWEEISNSDLNLFPDSYQFGPAPEHPVPVPGKPRLA